MIVRPRHAAILAWLMLAIVGCAGPQRSDVVARDGVAHSPRQDPLQSPGQVRDRIGGVLDAFHLAASAADGDAYFACMTDDAVFIGTDPTERWTRGEFEAFCRPFFEKGTGWTYRPLDRHVTLGPASAGLASVAWFDEHLDNDKYGLCRGSGVLVRTPTGWRIALYRLGLEVPNDAASAVVAAIAAVNGHVASLPASAAATTVILVRHAEKAVGADAGPDPGLTDEGHARVERLARLLETVQLDAVYVTRTARTMATVEPIARLHGVEPVVLAPADNEGLVRRIVDGHAGDTVLVCGHSNTLPVIMNLLGVRELVTIDDSAYDDVFVVGRPVAAPAMLTRLSSRP